jgi:hypothetical protein
MTSSSVREHHHVCGTLLQPTLKGKTAAARSLTIIFFLIPFVHRLAVNGARSKVAAIALYEPVVLSLVSNRAMSDRIRFGNIGRESPSYRFAPADFSCGFDK